MERVAKDARFDVRIRRGESRGKSKFSVRVKVPPRSFNSRQAHARVKAESAHAVGFEL